MLIRLNSWVINLIFSTTQDIFAYNLIIIFLHILYHVLKVEIFPSLTLIYASNSIFCIFITSSLSFNRKRGELENLIRWTRIGWSPPICSSIYDTGRHRKSKNKFFANYCGKSLLIWVRIHCECDSSHPQWMWHVTFRFINC